jgi:hypothetical protein
VASFNPQPFDKGYRMSHPRFSGKSWREFFNSDAKAYGGTGGRQRGCFDRGRQHAEPDCSGNRPHRAASAADLVALDPNGKAPVLQLARR